MGDPFKIVLKVNLNCCEACPKKLEKALFKLTSISSHTINTEENLVSVSGTVMTDTILKLIYAKIAKKAEVVSYERLSTEDKEKKPKNTKNVEDKDSINKIKSPHKKEMHKTTDKVSQQEELAKLYEDMPTRFYYCKEHPESPRLPYYI